MQSIGGGSCGYAYLACFFLHFLGSLQLYRQPSLPIFPRGKFQAEKTSTLEMDRTGSNPCFVMSSLYDCGPQFDHLTTGFSKRLKECPPAVVAIYCILEKFLNSVLYWKTTPCPILV